MAILSRNDLKQLFLDGLILTESKMFSLIDTLFSKSSVTSDLPITRALVPAINGADLSIKTHPVTSYLYDSLDFSGSADESAYFQFVAAESFTGLDVIGLVESAESSGGVLTLSAGLTVISGDDNLSGSEQDTATVNFTFSSADDVQSETLELRSMDVAEGDLIILKVYRVSSDVADTSTEDLNLLSLKVTPNFT